MAENRELGRRDINTGTGNYNEFIGRDYIQAEQVHIANYYYRKDVTYTPVKSVDAADENLPCPYRGLFHFDPNDAEFFFGREVFVEELFEATQNRNFIPVLGASGSGKSSVVLAGLVPKLQQEEHWLFTHFRPGSDPFHALSLALVPLYTQDLDNTDKIIQARKLAQSLGKGEILLNDVFAQIHQNHSNSRVLLIADQFEELYTLCGNQKIRLSFLDTLLANFQSFPSQSQYNHVLVTTMRADFLGNALSYRPFADVLQNADIKLGPMNREELTKVIEKPVDKLELGVTFQEGLVKRILDDVDSEPGNLPLLEFALTELWKRRRGKQLTHAAYEEIGEVKGALAGHADENYHKLSKTEQEQVRRIFIQLVRPGEGTEDTRRLATKGELGEANWVLVKQLADARLVVTSRNAADQETVEVVHEALIRNWGKFQQWMKSDRNFRGWQEKLRVAMHQWKEANRDEEALLRGMPLTVAQEWLKERSVELSVTEQEYIRQSVALRDRLVREKEEREQRELQLIRELLEQETKARQAENKALRVSQTRTKLAFATAGSAIAVLLVLGFSFWQQGQSQRTIEAVFLGANTTEIVNSLPKLHKEADNLKSRVDRLNNHAENSDKAITYYRNHKRQLNKLFAYYRNIINATGNLKLKVNESDKNRLQTTLIKAEKSLAQMIYKYRIPKLKLELKQPNPNFGQLLPNKKRTEFEQQYSGALRTTYEILMRSSGAGADLNNDGYIRDRQEANQMPCEILREIERLWREATDGRCGWYGEEGQYEDADCRELPPDRNTLYVSIFEFTQEYAITRIKDCGISPR